MKIGDDEISMNDCESNYCNNNICELKKDG